MNATGKTSLAKREDTLHQTLKMSADVGHCKHTSDESFPAKQNIARTSDQVNRIKEVLGLFPSRPSLASSVLSAYHVKKLSGKVPFCRTLLWKTSLLHIDITHMKNGNSVMPFFDMTNLKGQRELYETLVTNIGIPWHLLPKDSLYYREIKDDVFGGNDVEEDLCNLKLDGQSTVHMRKTKLKSQPVPSDEDPLRKPSLESFEDKEESDVNILQIIISDVERLFPEHPHMFIEDTKNKKMIIEILYRYTKWSNHLRESKGDKKIGYVQGMHELCGIIHAVLKVELLTENEKVGNTDATIKNYDLSVEREDTHVSEGKLENEATMNSFESKLEEQIKYFLSEKYFAHDVFAMFKELTLPLLDKYFTSSGIVRESIFFDLKLHHLDLGSANRPGLATSLRESHIESQLWLTRWFRMLLTREVGLAYAVRIWDGLIAYSCAGAQANTTENENDVSTLIPYIVILLILRVRSVLLSSMVPSLKEILEAYGEEKEPLSVLLHYPFDDQEIQSPRSASPDPDDENVDSSITSYRLSKDIRYSKSYKELKRMLKIPKMPSSVTLLSDAILLCGKTDAELNEMGPLLTKKYARDDVYDVLKLVEKDKLSSASFFDGVLKRTKSWKIAPSPSSSGHSAVSSSASNGVDSNRTRLETRLQQRVHDRLRN